MWDIVSELVCLCTVPSPSNPFALDTRYIRGLPLPERFLATGALLNFLEMYVVYGNQDELHYDKGMATHTLRGKSQQVASVFSNRRILMRRYFYDVRQQMVLFSYLTRSSGVSAFLPL